jgi:hypothetical protein
MLLMRGRTFASTLVASDWTFFCSFFSSFSASFCLFLAFPSLLLLFAVESELDDFLFLLEPPFFPFLEFLSFLECLPFLEFLSFLEFLPFLSFLEFLPFLLFLSFLSSSLPSLVSPASSLFFGLLFRGG